MEGVIKMAGAARWKPAGDIAVLRAAEGRPYGSAGPTGDVRLAVICDSCRDVSRAADADRPKVQRKRLTCCPPPASIRLCVFPERSTVIVPPLVLLVEVALKEPNLPFSIICKKITFLPQDAHCRYGIIQHFQCIIFIRTIQSKIFRFQEKLHGRVFYRLLRKLCQML